MARGAFPWIVVVAGMLSMGCQDRIGDACGSSTDCSITGDRQCDLAQPGGYCTVFACDPDTCPEGVCVEWRFNPSRTAQTWCMRTCNADGDCRVEYYCAQPSQILPNGRRAPAPLPENERTARVIDLQGNRATASICAARPPPGDLGDPCLTDAECDQNAADMGAFCCIDEDQCGANRYQCVASCPMFSADAGVQEGDDCQDNTQCVEGLFCCLAPDAEGNCDFALDQDCTCREPP